MPQDPIDEDLQNRIETTLNSILLSRRFQTGRLCELQGPAIRQHTKTGKSIAVAIGVSDSLAVVEGHTDIIIRSAEGYVLRDSKKERIAGDAAFLDAIVPRLAKSPTLRALFESFSQSISDRDDEFLHLYEIRDALKTHFGGIRNARLALNISEDEWNEFGDITCGRPVKPSRHRGRHLNNLREATPEELNRVRGIAVKWILAFAGTL
jgi:hypothetical protein